MRPSVETWVLAGFHVFIGAMLALDLGVFQRKAHAVTLREAAARSAFWVVLALGFAWVIRHFWYVWDPEQADRGPAKALEFVTGYLVELSLSVDNLFVFLVIFRYFGVPEHARHHILVWGILGAVALRATFILAGAALLHAVHWAIYVFALFLLYTAYRLTRSVEEEIDPSRNWVLRAGRRLLPMVEGYAVTRFWVRRDGRWHATPLALVLLVIESTDVVFAVDSIPAVFGITKDAFIVYTSNICAILGLRSFYFLVSGVLGMFRYLHFGLSGVLAFVGLKMLLEEPLPALRWPGLPAVLKVSDGEWILLSLGVIATILGVAVVASVWAGQAPPDTPPAGAGENTPAASPHVADDP